MTVTSTQAVSTAAPASRPGAPAAPSAPLSGPAAVISLSSAAQKLLDHTGSNVPWGNSPARDK